MHKLYAEYFTAVEADFALNIRKTPISLQQIKAEVRWAICSGLFSLVQATCHDNGSVLQYKVSLE